MTDMTFIPFYPFANGGHFASTPHHQRSHSCPSLRPSSQQLLQLELSYEEKSCIHCLREGLECDGNRPCMACLTLGRSDACDRRGVADGPAMLEHHRVHSDSVVIQPLDTECGEFVTLRSSAIYEPVSLPEELNEDGFVDRMHVVDDGRTRGHSREQSSSSENGARKRKRNANKETTAEVNNHVGGDRGPLTRKRSKTDLGADVTNALQRLKLPEQPAAPLPAKCEPENFLAPMCWREGSWDLLRGPSYESHNFLSASFDTEFSMNLNLSNSIRSSSHGALSSSHGATAFRGADTSEFFGHGLLSEASQSGPGFEMDLDRFSAGVPL